MVEVGHVPIPVGERSTVATTPLLDQTAGQHVGHRMGGQPLRPVAEVLLDVGQLGVGCDGHLLPRSSHRTRTGRRRGPAGGRRGGPWRAAAIASGRRPARPGRSPHWPRRPGPPGAVSAACTARALARWCLTRTAMSWGRTGRVPASSVPPAARRGRGGRGPGPPGPVDGVGRRVDRRPRPWTWSGRSLRPPPGAPTAEPAAVGRRRRCDGPGSAAPR